MRRRNPKRLPLDTDIAAALQRRDFLSVQLAHNADFRGRPWLFLSVVPGLDDQIHILNKVLSIAMGLVLLPVLAFDEETGSPVVPFVQIGKSSLSQHATMAGVTALILDVAEGMAAEVQSSRPIQDHDETAEPDEALEEARTRKVVALEKAFKLGLTEANIKSVVEALAKTQNRDATVLIPAGDGSTRKLMVGPLELLRGPKPTAKKEKRVYSGIVSGWDEINDILILDGRLAIKDCSQNWPVRPSVGNVVKVRGVRKGKVELAKIDTEDPSQNPLLQE